jgi:hypothetical protein
LRPLCNLCATFVQPLRPLRSKTLKTPLKTGNVPTRNKHLTFLESTGVNHGQNYRY